MNILPIETCAYNPKKCSASGNNERNRTEEPLDCAFFFNFRAAGETSILCKHNNLLDPGADVGPHTYIRLMHFLINCPQNFWNFVKSSANSSQCQFLQVSPNMWHLILRARARNMCINHWSFSSPSTFCLVNLSLDMRLAQRLGSCTWTGESL